MSTKTPPWVDEYTKAVHQAFSNMLPATWGPVDVITLVSYLNGSFVRKVHRAVTALKREGVLPAQAARTFSNPSTFRVTLWYLLQDYAGAIPKPSGELREVLDYLAAALQSWVKEDLFALEKNIVHSSQEVTELMQHIRWQPGDPPVARELGRLYNSLAALAFALYRDFFPQEAHEIYGPYDVSPQGGLNTILIVKHFPKIKPTELWPHTQNFQYEEVRIYQVFRQVKFKCEFIGMHSIYEGDLINGLIQYAVLANGQPVRGLEEIRQLKSYFETLATEQSQIYNDMSHAELVAKVLEWLCYEFVGMFAMAGLDWRPTEEMKDAVAGKEIADRFEADEFPPFEEFVASKEFEVYWLHKLYQS